MNMKTLLGILLHLYIITVSFSDVSERELITHLLQNYTTEARPVLGPQSAVNVSVGFYLVSLERLDEKNQVLHSYAWLILEWNDQYMRWNPYEWHNISNVIINSKHLWKPDIIIRNSAKNLYGTLLDEDNLFRMMVGNDGSVHLGTAGIIDTSCLVDMTYFPFDDQACLVHVDSWTYDADRVFLSNDSSSIHLDAYRESGEWTILDTEVQHVVHEVDGTKYTRIFMKLYLRRKALYYVYNILVPPVILSVLVLLIFWMPAESGEKISLGITVLLSFSVFQLLVAEGMPRTSDFIPLLGVYIICTMTLTGLSLVCTVAVLCLHHHRPDAPVPLWLRRIVVFGNTLCCLKRSYVIDKQETVKEENPQMTQTPPLSTNHNVLRVSTNDDSPPDKPPTSEIMQGKHASLSHDRSYPRTVRQRDEAIEHLRNGWFEVAKVLDRLLLVVFVMLIVCTTLTLFVIVPLNKPDRPSIRQTPK